VEILLSKTNEYLVNLLSKVCFNNIMDKKIYEKITQKKEFSELPKKDVGLAFEKFDKENYCDEEKIKFTRNLLRNVFSGFTSLKLLNIKNKSPAWILNKHLSTRERFEYYEEIYKRIFNGVGKNLSVIDLGAGVNGFSYGFFKKLGFNVCYTAIESMGQLVKLMNCYFLENKLNAKAIYLSLFETGKVKNIIMKEKNLRIVFLFKVIDSLEMLERDYSKKLISEITPLVKKVVVSFATRSMGRRKNFRANRKWLVDFIRNNFFILDDFEFAGERYLVFRETKDL